MKIDFVLTDDGGKRFEGSAELTFVGGDVGSRRQRRREVQVRKAAGVDFAFSLNLRAFMKKYGRGLKGPSKFTLMLARLAEGDVGRQVAFEDLKAAWNSMKPLMGGAFYPSPSLRAKEHGWVDTPKRGIYALTSSWKEAIEERNG